MEVYTVINVFVSAFALSINAGGALLPNKRFETGQSWPAIKPVKNGLPFLR